MLQESMAATATVEQNFATNIAVPCTQQSLDAHPHLRGLVELPAAYARSAAPSPSETPETDWLDFYLPSVRSPAPTRALADTHSNPMTPSH
jgi:hypothetical protein